MSKRVFLEKTATCWNPSEKDQSGFKSLNITFKRKTIIRFKHLFAKKCDGRMKLCQPYDLASIILEHILAMLNNLL